MSELLPGVRLLDVTINRDKRGEFREIYNPQLAEDIGISSFVQVNFSSSKSNVFRGFHLQTKPWSQGKLIQCLSGAIIDFILDPNPRSITFGEISRISLSEDSGKAIWVPGQYAHGFLSLQENSRIVYAVSQPWKKEFERSINPASTRLAKLIDLSNVTISDKDRSAPTISEISEEIAGGD